MPCSRELLRPVIAGSLVFSGLAVKLDNLVFTYLPSNHRPLPYSVIITGAQVRLNKILKPDIKESARQGKQRV